MNSKYGLIIFAVVIILNVLGGIMKKRAEQQKLAKLSGSRTHRSDPARQKTRSSLATPAPSQRSGRAMDRAQQLAERRKAQLDELRSRRQRRAGAQQQQQHPQARIGSGSSHTTPSAFRSTPPQRPQQPTPAKPQRVVIRPSAQPKPAPVSRSVFAEHSEHTRADIQRLHGKRAQLGEAAASTPYKPTRITPTSSILDSGELTPELLRRMVVLKEIFDRPVALRDSEIWDRL